MARLTRFSEERYQEVEQELSNNNGHVRAKNLQLTLMQELKDESDITSKKVMMIDNY